MADLHDLYQELIIDHGCHPRNFKRLTDATVQKEGFNPLCGDRLILFLKIDNDCVMDASFEGKGCAISMAAASLMTEALKGKSCAEAKKLFSLFHALVTNTTGNNGDVEQKHREQTLGKLFALKGVCEYPSRVKCATLAWHTLIAAIDQKTGRVSTE